MRGAESTGSIIAHMATSTTGGAPHAGRREESNIASAQEGAEAAAAGGAKLPEASVDPDDSGNAGSGNAGSGADAGVQSGRIPTAAAPGEGSSAGSVPPAGIGADRHTRMPPALPPLPWLAWEPGTRVVVRYRLADGLHDALGDLLEVAADHVTVRTRRGDIRVEASTMVTGKKVPPPVW